MFKTATAAILSATLAFSSIAPAPAQAADSGELARFLFGVATLAIIANELNDNGRAHANDRVVHGQITRPHGNVITPAKPSRSRSVPLACQRTVATSDGTRRLFGVPCLTREGVNVARLPQDCRRTLQLPRRTVDAFGSRCLRSSGVKVVN